MRVSSLVIGLALSAASMVIWPLAASAVWYTWDGTANWSSSGNWNPLGPPVGPTTGALIRSGTLTIDATTPSANTNAVLVGWAGSAAVNMTGGTLTVTGNGSPPDQTLAIGEQQPGTFTQSGGIVTTNRLDFGRVGGPGTYSLNSGGTLQVSVIAKAGGSGTFNFNGGTLRATAGGNWIASGITANVQSGGAVIDTQAFDVTVSSALLDGGGGGGLTKNGFGTLRLVANNTYTGGTTVSGGTLQIGNGEASTSVGASSFSVAGGANLVFNRNIDDVRFTTQSISGDGDVIFRGRQNGYFTFRTDYTGALTYTGHTKVDFTTGGSPAWYQRTLWLEKDDLLPHSTVLELQSGKVYMRNSGTSGQTVAGLTGNAGTFVTTDSTLQKLNIDVATGQTYTYAGVIGADGTGHGNDNIALAKSGPGTQVLTGANTYTGATAINGGILQVGDGGTAGSLGATAVTIAGPGNLIFNRSDSVTFAGTIAGNGALTQMGAGTLVLTGNSTSFTGTTTVSGGTLQIGNNTAMQMPAASPFVLQNGANLVFYLNAYNTSYPATNISGMGNVEFRGQSNGWISTNHVNFTYDGTTTVDLASGSFANGWLFIEGTGSLPSSTVLNVVNGYVSLRKGQKVAGLTGSGGTIHKDNGGTSTLTVNVAAGNVYSYGGVLGTGLALTKSGPGTQVLAGVNTYNGGTTATDGTLRVGNASALGTRGVTVNGGTLDLNAFSVTIPYLNESGGIITDDSAGVGTTTLTINQDVSASFGGVIQDGPGKKLALVQSGNGTLILTLSGNSTYTGGTWANGGFLTLGVDNALPTGTVLTFAPPSGTRASLNMDGHSQTLGGLVAASAAAFEGDIYNNDGNPTSTLTLNVPLGQTYVYANQIGPAAGWRDIAVVKDGPGTQIFTGDNFYTGSTTVSGGTLKIGNGEASTNIGASSPITLQNGSELVYHRNADDGVFGSVTGSGNVTLLGQADGYYSIRTTTPQFNYTGTTTLQLDSQAGNTYRGALFIEPGSVGLPSSTVLNIIWL